MSELHLFILWKNSLYKKEDILKDIKRKFEIINIYNVTWSDEKFSENLSRFYGVKLPDGSLKEIHCGRGSFLLIIVKDNNPKYSYRQTTAGKEYVNINTFDSKVMYRDWTGGGHKIHCTNSIKETNHDLTLLLDKNVEDYLKDISKQNHIIDIDKDLIGSNGFDTVEEMFYALNNCTQYAILRNYENLPEEIYLNEHNDIDIICNSRENTAYVLNAKKHIGDENYRVRYHVNIAESIANFDIRYIGDNYYDRDMEIEILNNREFNEKGFYTLSNEDYFNTLLYHALIHKLDFSDDYKVRLMNMNNTFSKEICYDIEKSIKFLQKWMLQNEYIVVRPCDLTVGLNNRNLKYISKLIYKNDDNEVYLKERNSVLENKNSDLINELNYIKKTRVWKVIKFIRNINYKMLIKFKNI